jgi:non-catalytic primase subunit PriX-like protein
VTKDLGNIENKKIMEYTPQSVTPPTIAIEESTKAGLHFILGHFTEPLWPRTVSTRLTGNRQVPVYSIEQALELYHQAGYSDCRINAFPYHTEFKGVNRQEPDFIFAGDLDASRFKSLEDLDTILKKTCRNIAKDIGGCPTVIWSGNGYHVYQPVVAPLLELESQFARFDRPSTELLRYTENRFTNGKTDPCHKPTVKSCMVRVPGSVTSKNGQQVRIVQKWNGDRPQINPILFDFYIYLANKRIAEQQQQQSMVQQHHKIKRIGNTINWIEWVLDTGLSDYRKYAITFIVAPYLINIKNQSYSECFDVIENWLNDKCVPLRPLDNPRRDFHRRIKDSIQSCIKKGWKPQSLDKLKLHNKQLYDEIMFSSNKRE